MKIQDFAAFSATREAGLAKLLPGRPRISVGMAPLLRERGRGVYHAFRSEIDAGHGRRAGSSVAWLLRRGASRSTCGPGHPLLMLHRVQRSTLTGS